MSHSCWSSRGEYQRKLPIIFSIYNVDNKYSQVLIPRMTMYIFPGGEVQMVGLYDPNLVADVKIEWLPATPIVWAGITLRSHWFYYAQCNHYLKHCRLRPRYTLCANRAGRWGANGPLVECLFSRYKR